jgi:hypothetical protein
MIFATIAWGLLEALAGIFVNAFAIWLIVDRIFRFATFEKTGFRTALETSVASTVISFGVSLVLAFSPGISFVASNGILISALIINIAVLLFLIKNFYELPWGEATISWLTVAIVTAVANIIMNLLLGAMASLL